MIGVRSTDTTNLAAAEGTNVRRLVFDKNQKTGMNAVFHYSRRECQNVCV